jgi:hypothetical protein
VGYLTRPTWLRDRGQLRHGFTRFCNLHAIPKTTFDWGKILFQMEQKISPIKNLASNGLAEARKTLKAKKRIGF